MGLRDSTFDDVMVDRDDAVNVERLDTIVPDAEFSIRFDDPPDDSVPSPANDSEVGVILIVSILDTPVSAPADETLSPVEDRVNEAAVLPIEVLPDPVPR